MNFISDIVSRIRPTIKIGSDGTSTVSIEFQQSLTANNVDERIARLSQVHRDLLAAAQAVEALQEEANVRKSEVEVLRESVDRLSKDKDVSAAVLTLDQESIARLFANANKRLQSRSIWLGIIIGLVTGFLSSLAVWYLTTL